MSSKSEANAVNGLIPTSREVFILLTPGAPQNAESCTQTDVGVPDTLMHQNPRGKENRKRQPLKELNHLLKEVGPPRGKNV